MDTKEIQQRLTNLYKELDILETPWKNFIAKYHILQSNVETANTEEAQKYYREIEFIQNQMKAIKNRIHQLENLFSKEPLPLKTDYGRKEADMIRSSFEAPLYENFVNPTEDDDLDQTPSI